MIHYSGVACFGGAARRLSFIRDTVAAVNARNNSNALVLSGGCSFWGSFFYSMWVNLCEDEYMLVNICDDE